MFSYLKTAVTKGRSFVENAPGLWGDALRGATVGAGTGAIGSLISGAGIEGAFSGAISGAIYGAGLGAAGNFAAGRWGNREWGVSNKRFGNIVNQALNSKSIVNRGLNSKAYRANIGYNYANITAKTKMKYKDGKTPPFSERYGLSIGGQGGRVGLTRLSANSGTHVSLSITGLAGFAGGLMGMNGSSKRHSTMSSNGWNMGTAGQGYYSGVGY